MRGVLSLNKNAKHEALTVETPSVVGLGQDVSVLGKEIEGAAF